MVEPCHSSGKSTAQVARDLGVAETAVRRWVGRAEIDARRQPGLTTEEHAEWVALRKENRVLREERDPLRRDGFTGFDRRQPRYRLHRRSQGPLRGRADLQGGPSTAPRSSRTPTG